MIWLLLRSLLSSTLTPCSSHTESPWIHCLSCNGVHQQRLPSLTVSLGQLHISDISLSKKISKFELPQGHGSQGQIWVPDSRQGPRSGVYANSIWMPKRRTNPSSYHVWAEGRRSVDLSSRWIWNFWMPFMPSRAAKPCRGTFEVPVTNWRNLARSAWSKERNALQNHWICNKGHKKPALDRELLTEEGEWALDSRQVSFVRWASVHS